MKIFWFVPALCLGIFLSLPAAAADTPAITQVPTPTPVVEPDSTIAPTTTLTAETPYAATPPITQTSGNRAMQVVGVLIGLALLAAIIGWGVSQRGKMSRRMSRRDSTDIDGPGGDRIDRDYRDKPPVGVN